MRMHRVRCPVHAHFSAHDAVEHELESIDVVVVRATLFAVNECQLFPVDVHTILMHSSHVNCIPYVCKTIFVENAIHAIATCTRNVILASVWKISIDDASVATFAFEMDANDVMIIVCDAYFPLFQQLRIYVLPTRHALFEELRNQHFRHSFDRFLLVRLFFFLLSILIRWQLTINLKILRKKTHAKIAMMATTIAQKQNWINSNEPHHRMCGLNRKHNIVRRAAPICPTYLYLHTALTRTTMARWRVPGLNPNVLHSASMCIHCTGSLIFSIISFTVIRSLRPTMLHLPIWHRI